MDKVNKKTEQFKLRLNESLAHFDAIKEAATLYVETYKKFIILDPDRPAPEFGESEGPIPKLDAATNRIIETYEGADQAQDPADRQARLLHLPLRRALPGPGHRHRPGRRLDDRPGRGAGGHAGRRLPHPSGDRRHGPQADHRGRRADGHGPERRRAPRRTLGYQWIQENAKRLKARVESSETPRTRSTRITTTSSSPSSKVRHDADIKAAEDRYPKALAEAAKKYETDLSAAETKYKKRPGRGQGQRREAELQELDARYFAEVEARQNAYEAAWQKLIDDWRTAINFTRFELDATTAESDRMFLPWNSPSLGPLEASRRIAAGPPLRRGHGCR